MLDHNGFKRCKSFVLQGLYVYLFFLTFNLPKLGTGARMTGGEYGAAILIGKNGGFKRIDLAGDADDLFLIHTDAGTEYGARNDTVGNAERLHGLACYLTKAFAGDECVASEFFCGAFGKAHHEATEEESEVIFLTAVAKDLLDLGDGDDVNVDIACVSGKLFSESENLFSRAFACVGEAFEMHGV